MAESFAQWRAGAGGWGEDPGSGSLIAPIMASLAHGESGGRRAFPVEHPIGTTHAGGGKHALVAAFLAQHNGGMVGHSAVEPVSTITQRGTQQQVVSAGLLNLKGSERRMSAPEAPAPTVTAGGWHQAEVRAFLTKYYGAEQDPRLAAPLLAGVAAE